MSSQQPDPKSDRRERAAAVRSATANADRRRSYLIVGVCLLLGVLIIGGAAWGPIKARMKASTYDNVALEDIGAPATACGEITTKPATGNQEHVDEGTPLTITDSPPAFGAHYPVWEGMERKLYTKSDRPPLGRLLHNLEHGYTILWYDETVADDAEKMDVLRGLAEKNAGTDNMRHKFKAAPWTSEDGKPFPDGQHVAFTHWSVGGVGDGATGKQVGAFQYCSKLSGAALQDFMEKYPYMDSPEPGVV